ncbi:3'-5' exonuclease [Grimontia hollisae]|uniref:DNA polymerase III epsilon subunit n=2 Tax=Grimontia hollisae TaxID=673 RepID=D0I3D1_GRIHO|nr:3'-5' exonuclease [Grimontia hollisae]AMG30824.1 3'-5' exonuclease [Grimontia hollisae]EEY73952.1 DNA polymerase III epsilon subunit [Grimontia hollisae CIP 101886]MDF2186420.1 3'-5' exonuclease [Grimontia hollisae]STO47326.1 DNA polymerase III polC-type [Grimontia hollisae]STO56264.1 DNA polymerase III polC-type [Grimontia hollisae]
MNPLERLWLKYKWRDTQYAPLFTSPSNEEMVALDCETTSLDPHKAELVTIAATKIRGNTIVTSDPLTLSLRAPHSLTEQSVKIHGIRHQDLHDGVTEKEAMQALIEFAGNRPIVGYYIHYDKTILDRYTRKHLGFKLPNSTIEVSDIYRRKLEQILPNAYYDLSMEAIGHHLGLPLSGRHDALDDAISAALIYIRLKYGDVSIPTYV